ncbi:MAG: hypothetical protein E6R02_06525 [Gammaproteobacteria bacterium]|nr:MAG: hypothetical protein E6R02_06525 [Gammaproteobacteria bacterium]
MSTRAQIAIQIGPNEWAHTYVHYDGYSSHMLPSLAPWTPEDILAAIEIRQVRADEIEAFDKPRDPVILPRPTCQFCHLYVWQDGAWIELDPATHAPEGAAP